MMKLLLWFADLSILVEFQGDIGRLEFFSWGTDKRRERRCLGLSWFLVGELLLVFYYYLLKSRVLMCYYRCV